MSSKTDSLLQSVSVSDTSSVRRLLEDADENTRLALFNEHDDRGRTPIHVAATLDSTEILEELLNADANMNVQDFFQQTPVFEAVLAKQINTVKFLVENHALIETENNQGLTPIFMAAKVKDAEILEYFCEEGVDINHTSRKGETPLCVCATLFWREGLEILEKYGAKLDTNAPGAIPILQPVFNKMAKKGLWDDQDALDTVAYLIERGANINLSLPPTEAGPSSPLQVSISKDRKSLFDVLVKGKPQMNEALPNGKLPLQQAIERNLIDFVQPIIDAGANINYLFDDNQSYLHIAAAAGAEECFDKLLELYQENGPDYNKAADDLQQWIADQKEANIAEGRGNRAIVLPPIQDRFDVLRKVDPFFVDKNGNTPLMLAAKAGHMEICEKLITLGCDPSYENKKRHSAYTVATSENAEQLIEIANRDGMDELFDKFKVLEPYHDRFDTPKPSDETSKSILMNSRGSTLSKTGKGKTVQLSLTQRTALLEEKKSNSPPQSPIARPWGGSSEAEEFRRKTRVELRNLKQEMKDRVKDLREQIEKLYEEFEVELPQ